MENHIGEIIYIVIGLVIFLFSSLSKRRKRQAANSRQPEKPAGKTSEVQEMLREMFDIPQPEEERSDVQYNYDTFEEEVVEEPFPDQPVSELEKIIPEQELEPQFVKPGPVNSKEYSTDNQKDTHPVLEDFDIQKAVIYSEILKPKYF